MKSVSLQGSSGAGLLGAINGVLFAFAVNPLRNAYDQWDEYRLTVMFNGVPPLMSRMLKPQAELLLCVLAFTLSSFLVHRLWRRRVKSTIVLWQFVAVVAIAGTFTLSYLQNRIGRLVSAVHWRLEQGRWGELPGFSQDVSYPLLLLVVAISLNFFYGAALQGLVSCYPLRFKE